MIDLDDRLDRAADDLWSVLPTSRAATSSRTIGRARALAGFAASAVVLVALVAVWTWRDDPVEAPLLDAPAASATAPTTAPTTTAPTTTSSATTVPATTLVPPPPVPTNPQPSDAWPPAGSTLENEVEYVIREGDYPATVATLWKVPFEDLMTFNGWTLQESGIVPEWPGVGGTVRIPAGAVVPDLSSEFGGPTVEVVEQDMQVTLTSDFDCEIPSGSAGFDTFTLSLFSDREAGRWVLRATFPDQSTFDLIGTGSVLYPTTLHARGAWNGVDTNCAVFGPNQAPGRMIGEGAIVALNLEDDLGEEDRPFHPGDVDPAAQEYGDRTSMTGWPGTGWALVEQVPYTADDMTVRTVERRTRWIVADDVVVERRFENRMEGLGTATVTISMVGYGGTLIDAASFDTSDARPLVPNERPAVPDADGTPSAVEACGTYTVVEGDVPAIVAAELATTLDALEAVNLDTPGWDSWFPGLVIQVPC